MTLLAKWVWRFREKEDALWVKIVKSLHGTNGGMGDQEIDKAQGGGWKCILKKLNSLNCFSLNPINLMQVEIGNGSSFKF